MKPSPANGLSTFYLFFTVLGLSILNDVFHLTDSELLLFFSAIFLADGLTAGTLRLREKRRKRPRPSMARCFCWRRRWAWAGRSTPG